MTDELTLLRQARPETEPADSLVVLRARRALLRRALAGRNRRRYAIRALVGAAAAAAVLGVVGIVDVGGDHGGVNPAAAAVLDRAAEVSLKETDPVVGPGQYLRTTLVEQGWSAATSDRTGKIRIGTDGKPIVYQERRTREIWIPHDPDSPWVIRDGTVALKNISKDAKAFNTGEPAETHTEQSWADKTNKRMYLKTYDPAWYATLPRDPDALLARLKAEDPGEPGSSLNFYFQEVFSEVLRSGVAPADIRAALFKALAATPGMKVVNGVTNLDGRSGVAIGYGSKGWQMLFDRGTGQYIGERASSPHFPDVPGLDKAKTTWLTSVHTDVVDSAPTPRNR